VNSRPQVHWGLENIYVTETKICFIDLEHGKIYYRGYDLIELAEKASFEEVAYLLIFGKLPNRKELEDFEKNLLTYRNVPSEIVKLLHFTPKSSSPIDVLKFGINYLGLLYGNSTGLDRKASLEDALRIIAQSPVIVAYFERVRSESEIIPPRGDLDHIANFVYMVFGRVPDEIEYKVLKSLFIVYADHSMANSTFTAITTASTLTDIYSVITSAISSLKGPLHGGANAEALKMLFEIESPDAVEDFVKRKIEKKEKIMGFGHRIYKKITDPRAVYLKELAKILAKSKGGVTERLYSIASRLEEAVMKYLGHKGVYPNVDLYASIILYGLGFSVDMNPAIFALARIVGWIAHVFEYWERNKLIRPLDYYIGPSGLKYVPINERE